MTMGVVLQFAKYHVIEGEIVKMFGFTSDCKVLMCPNKQFLFSQYIRNEINASDQVS